LALPPLVLFPPSPAAASSWLQVSSRSYRRAGPWTSPFSASRALPPSCAQAWRLPCRVSSSSCAPQRASLLWPWRSPLRHAGGTVISAQVSYVHYLQVIRHEGNDDRAPKAGENRHAWRRRAKVPRCTAASPWVHLVVNIAA